MSREDAILVEGTIVEVLGPALFCVELANGHRVLSHPARKDREALAGLAVGGRVNLEMSPFDMSNGRILNRDDLTERTKINRT